MRRAVYNSAIPDVISNTVNRAFCLALNYRLKQLFLLSLIHI